MAELTINPAPKYWDVSDVLSVQTEVRKASTNPASAPLKKGALVFANGSGGYVAVANAKIASQTGAVGVLMQDLDYLAAASSGDEEGAAVPPVQVMYAGKMYIEGVRAAGITEAECSDEQLYALAGHIIFVKEEEVNYGA